MTSDIQNLIPSRQPEFRFRLNRGIVPELFVQRALVNSEPIGEWQIVVDIDRIGKITLDDNSNLSGPGAATVRLGVP